MTTATRSVSAPCSASARGSRAMIALAAAGALALVGGSAAMAWPALKSVFAAPAHMPDAPVLAAPAAPSADTAQPVAGFVAATAAPRAPVVVPDPASGAAAADRPALLEASAGAVGVPAPAAALGPRRAENRLPSAAGNAPPSRPAQADLQTDMQTGSRTPEAESDGYQTVRPAAARPAPPRPAQLQAPRAQARTPQAAPEPAAERGPLVHRIDPRHRWSIGEMR